MKQTHAQTVSEIHECERLSAIYTTLYELLCCPDFEQKDIREADKNWINKNFSDFPSLDALGSHFSELADREYHTAQQLLKQIKNR